MIKFPRWAIDMIINSQMGHFLWNNTEDRHRYHLANWQLVAQKKDFGGLGIPDLRSLNLSLLCAWIFRYHLNSNAIWVRILDSNIELKILTFSIVRMWELLLFGKGCSGLHRLPIWVSSGLWAMEGR